MVEPPGTAPGSDPLIPCAFIAIVRFDPNNGNIGAATGAHKHPSSSDANGDAAARVPVRRSGLIGQNPALIFSNSATIRSRCAALIGVCDNRMPSTGSTSAAFSSSIEIVAIAASLAWA